MQLMKELEKLKSQQEKVRKEIEQLQNRQKILLNRKTDTERRARTRRQLDKVKPGKKEAFEQKHGTELALYEAAARYLEKLKSGGEPVTPKKWRAESEKLTVQKEIHYQEMRSMREQIKAVENLRKAADQLERSQQDRNRKKEDNQL